MKLSFTVEQEAFRAEVAAWLDEQLSGPFADIRGITSQTAAAQRRQDWEKALGVAGWCAIGWPKQYGGRDADLAQQVIFAEEYARARAPGRPEPPPVRSGPGGGPCPGFRPAPPP